MSRVSLAQQIAQLEDTVPDYDPEDAYNTTKPTGTIDDDEELHSDEGGREHYVEVGPSTLRKLHDSGPDPKYGAVKTSRNKIFDDDEDTDEGGGDSFGEGEEGEDDDEDEDMDMEAYKSSKPFGAYNEGDDDEEIESDDEDMGPKDEDGDYESEEDEDDDDDEGEDDERPSKSKPADDGDRELADALRKTREQDRAKGKAVAKQISTWDTLLDARIRLQKSVIAANRLPMPHELSQATSSEAGKEAVWKLMEASLNLSDDLCELQETYLTVNEEIDLPPRKKRKLDSDDVDYKSQVINASESLANLEALYHRTLLQTITKWSTKVQAVTPSLTSFKRGQPLAQKGAVELIDETLSGGKAVARTQVRRAGAEGGREGDEVFDDTDFYQVLLRDVIESRTGKDNAASLDAADAWARKQKKAQKAERALANKDRRVRYDVHEKLQNFMVPVPVSRGAWHEEQVDELFSSLLGKGFEGAAQENAPIPRADAELAGLVGLGGLRVF